MRVITPLSTPPGTRSSRRISNRAHPLGKQRGRADAFGYTPAELLGRKIDILSGAKMRRFGKGCSANGRDKASAARAGRCAKKVRRSGHLHRVIRSMARGRSCLHDDRLAGRYRTDCGRSRTEGKRASATRSPRSIAATRVDLFAPTDDCDLRKSAMGALHWELLAETTLARFAWLQRRPRRRIAADAEAAWRSSLAAEATSTPMHDCLTSMTGRTGGSSYGRFPVRHRRTGMLREWFGTATDITDLVEARDTLRRSNERIGGCALPSARRSVKPLSSSFINRRKWKASVN